MPDSSRSPSLFAGAIGASLRWSLHARAHSHRLPCSSRLWVRRRPGEALVIPQDALVFDIDNYYAFVEVSPGTFEHRKVSISSWSRVGYARIVSGLKAGDRVVSGETLQVNALWHEAHGESS